MPDKLTRAALVEARARIAKMENALRSMAGRKDLNQASAEWSLADAEALKTLIANTDALLAEPRAWWCAACVGVPTVILCDDDELPLEQQTGKCGNCGGTLRALVGVPWEGA